MSAVKGFLKNSNGDAAQVSADLAELVRRLERVKSRTGKAIALSPFVTDLLQKVRQAEVAEGHLHPARA